MDMTVNGMNFKHAPMQARERIALSPSFITRLLLIVRKEAIADEALILSTCNRTEFCLAGGGEEDFSHLLVDIAVPRDIAPTLS